MSDATLPTLEQIKALHARLDAEQYPTIEHLAVTKGWGFGRIIQICHRLWDDKMAQEHGIAGHSQHYALAEAEVLLQAQAQKSPEHAAVFLDAVKALDAARSKMQ